MTRTLLRACVLLALPALATGTATAQVIISPSSTAEGDILRGQGAYAEGLGAYAQGLGFYSLYSAQGRSIDAQTSMALREYAYRSMRQFNEDRAKYLAERRKHTIDAYNSERKRIRDDPNNSDLARGDTLNLVLQDLWDPNLHPSVLRYSRVPLSVSAVHALPFQIARLGGVISRRTLTVDNGNGWPVELKAPALDAERKAYLAAVDTFLERNLEGKLTLEAIRAVQKGVDDLKAGVERTIPQSDRFYIQAQAFLKELGAQAKLIESPVVRNILIDMEKYPGTSVADLVEFMRWYNLRFAPAPDGSPERELYPGLYEALVAQRDKVKGLTEEEKKAKAEPSASSRPAR